MEIEPHTVLGVPRGADRAQLDAAWRAAAKDAHPDRPGGSAERFRLARWAYEELTDPCKAGVPPPDVTPRRGRDRRWPLVVPPGVAIGGGVVLDALGRQVRVPPDTGLGDELRLLGLGGPGVPAGDLILEIDVAAAPPWQVHGLDLVGPCPLTWLELYRGKTVEIDLPGGERATVPVGPGTQPMSVLLFPGRGLRRDDVRGDLRLTVVPVAPAASDRTLESVLLRLQYGDGDEIRDLLFRDLNKAPT